MDAWLASCVYDFGPAFRTNGQSIRLIEREESEGETGCGSLTVIWNADAQQRLTRKATFIHLSSTEGEEKKELST